MTGKRLCLAALTCALTILGAVAGTAVAGPALTVTITGAPPSATGSDSATFEFKANERAGFTCSLDKSRPVACTSPVSYDDLAPGTHTFSVTATNTDRAGTPHHSTAEHAWTISPWTFRTLHSRPSRRR